jgi:hypothetical protein
MTYTDDYEEEMTREEKIESASERMKKGMLGFQDAMEAVSEVLMLQETYIEELERTDSCDTVRLHVTMFMVCVLCYIYGTYLGLYLGRK